MEWSSFEKLLLLLNDSQSAELMMRCSNYLNSKQKKLHPHEHCHFKYP